MNTSGRQCSPSRKRCWPSRQRRWDELHAGAGSRVACEPAVERRELQPVTVCDVREIEIGRLAMPARAEPNLRACARCRCIAQIAMAWVSHHLGEQGCRRCRVLRLSRESWVRRESNEAELGDRTRGPTTSLDGRKPFGTRDVVLVIGPGQRKEYVHVQEHSVSPLIGEQGRGPVAGDWLSRRGDLERGQAPAPLADRFRAQPSAR